MAIRQILEVPDPRLKTVSEPVAEFNDELNELVADMFETMYAAPGIGLAAIQVGVPKRVLVIDLQPEDEEAEGEVCNHGGHEHVHYPTVKEPRVFINPEILDPAEELASYQEGCLSVPDIFADVDRPATCRVRYQDLEGETHEEDLEGLMATCIQHEMDHLNGVLFVDRVTDEDGLQKELKEKGFERQDVRSVA